MRVRTDMGNNELPANHTFRIINGQVINGQITDEIEPTWLSNETIFRSIPLGQVIEEFERQYSVKIESKDLDMDKLFTGRFTHDDMILALKSITIPNNISYLIIDETHIQLTSDIK